MEFLKENKRFSLQMDGADAWSLPYESETAENGHTLTTVYRFANGLQITNVAQKHEGYGAYEWVNYLENTSDQPGPLLTELWDCDCTLPLDYEEDPRPCAYLPDAETATKVFAPNGSVWSELEFYCDADAVYNSSRIHHIVPRQTKEYRAVGGRSSEGQAPFFNVHKNGQGYLFAIGWTGQWYCQIHRSNDSITFRSKIEDTCFRLMPGERIRTSSVVIYPYRGDVLWAQNQWRRLVREKFSLIGQTGRDSTGPLCASVWGGMKTQSVLERIHAIEQNKLPFEYIWMDAGWYGVDTQPTPDEFEGDWSMHTGDWRVSTQIHPRGLRDVSEAIHRAGMKFLLWFEPERVIRTTPAVQEHPEFYLSNGNPQDPNLLLDLGNPDAWEACYQTLCHLIETLQIDGYRQDFNFWPLPYWRNHDAADRKGMTEIKHINGLYRLWDALLAKFPHLLIDNCASGGRRIDIETLRRSIPLWRSDYQCPANYNIIGTQCHNQTFSWWLPYSGTGSGRGYDSYRVRSAYAPAMTTNFSFSEKDTFCDTPEKAAFIRRYTKEYLAVRPYLSEDVYPLTEVSARTDIWCATQYHRPENNDGVLTVFRREESPYETACFSLRAMDADGTYRFTDADGGSFTVSGRELASHGFTLTIPEKRRAKIFFYHKES